MAVAVGTVLVFFGGPGRVRLRPNRGFPCSFAGQRQHPMTMPPTVEELRTSAWTIYFGDDVVGRGDAGSPGSDGASPYPELRPSCARASLRTVSRTIKVRARLMERLDVADTPTRFHPGGSLVDTVAFVH
jgi:hypothetical protein